METIHDGFAWRYGRYDKAGEFTDAEREAREKRRGLWVDTNSIPPWEYRRKRRHAATCSP
jgi:micrococcal nuclease